MCVSQEAKWNKSLCSLNKKRRPPPSVTLQSVRTIKKKTKNEIKKRMRQTNETWESVIYLVSYTTDPNLMTIELEGSNESRDYRRQTQCNQLWCRTQTKMLIQRDEDVNQWRSKTLDTINITQDTLIALRHQQRSNQIHK